MRLWSFHPKYLDVKGIVALWREALLAQKVLRGKTKGYRHHPQLERFKNSKDSARAIAFYLYGVWEEANRRGYHFDRRKILTKRTETRISLTRGQMKYEFDWLCDKLKRRDPVRYDQIKSMVPIEAHPLFSVRAGSVESWERIRKDKL
jgi:hypothetical protein